MASVPGPGPATSGNRTTARQYPRSTCYVNFNVKSLKAWASSGNIIAHFPLLLGQSHPGFRIVIFIPSGTLVCSKLGEEFKIYFGAEGVDAEDLDADGIAKMEGSAEAAAFDNLLLFIVLVRIVLEGRETD